MAVKKKQAVAKQPAMTAKEKIEHRAEVTLRPSANAAAVIAEYGKPFGEQDLGVLTTSLVECIDDVLGGDMKRCESMLLSQAHALQSIFMNLSRRALSQEYTKNFDTFLRLALKAQGQCRATLETLVTIKNPPVVFVRQANISHGPQQVNNGTSSPGIGGATHAEKTENQQTKLLTRDSHAALDTSGTETAIGVNQELETVAAIHRPQNA